MSTYFYIFRWGRFRGSGQKNVLIPYFKPSLLYVLCMCRSLLLLVGAGMCCAKQCVALYLYVTLCVFLEVSSRDRYALLLTKTENESERVWVYVYVCVCVYLVCWRHGQASLQAEGSLLTESFTC